MSKSVIISGMKLSGILVAIPEENMDLFGLAIDGIVVDDSLVIDVPEQPLREDEIELIEEYLCTGQHQLEILPLKK